MKYILNPQAVGEKKLIFFGFDKYGSGFVHVTFLLLVECDKGFKILILNTFPSSLLDNFAHGKYTDRPSQIAHFLIYQVTSIG